MPLRGASGSVAAPFLSCVTVLLPHSRNPQLRRVAYMDAANGTGSVPGTAIDVPVSEPPSSVEQFLSSATKTRSRIADELADLRDTEHVLIEELSRQMGEARARAASYQRAIDALVPRAAA